MKIKSLLTLVAVSSFFSAQAYASDWSHELGVEYRYFVNDPQFQEQAANSRSLVYLPVWSHSSESGNSLFDFRGYARYDADDSERSHVDINELAWTYSKGDWEFKSGISKVYWGVAESQHLVDIINQTDLVDSSDGETKLGQPLISATRITDVGEFSAYFLPYFRERTFAGREGRLRSNPVVDTDSPFYESADREDNLDYALRWAHTLGVVDIGVSYFNGTGRDPILRPNDNETALIPHYVQIEQLGLDVQATLDTWLLKLEMIDRSASESFQDQDYQSMVTGFEYSFYDVFERGIDLGLVGEYLYDSRDSLGGLNSVGFAAIRLALNDEQSTELLFGCTVNGNICAIEGSRRIGDDFKLTIEGSSFSGLSDDSQLSSQKDDDYIQFNVSYFF